MATISLMCSILAVRERSSSSTAVRSVARWPFEAAEEGVELFAFFVFCEEISQVGWVFIEQIDHFGEAGGAGGADGIDDEIGGDVDAVEDVADVVQHAGGHFRHARLA